ncbi:hypothetical protein CLOM_g18321 [Closterium sp. NIES-68]|nr:hypothetical protein CLOM_g18321 [Closterium sp. NIES-68]GJP61947.1 hypothetical protein CLOP_g19065 [Closterium sp. NIES-67]GJP65981.1 hypothetical protein CLOP_g22870 [Closterium sp. NIES-67]
MFLGVAHSYSSVSLPSMMLTGGFSKKMPMPRFNLNSVIRIAALVMFTVVCITLWNSSGCWCFNKGSVSNLSSNGEAAKVIPENTPLFRSLRGIYNADESSSSSSSSTSSLRTSAISESGSDGGSDGRPFIYVYDLGPEYTEKVLELNPAWYSHQYDVERYMTEVIRGSNAVRTDDPEQATLFLIPFFAARYTLYCFRSWENNMRQAIEEGSRVWEKLITRVRRDHPYFNRTNGRDHFSFGTLDHGRCHSLTFVDPRVYGEMFFVTLNGDKMVRSTHSSPGRNMQVISYNYGAMITDPTVPDIPCYAPDRDIVVPALVANRLPIVPPFETEREIKVLFRFGAAQHHGEPLKHHNRDIRRELIEMYRDAGHEGWDFAEKGEYETDEEWKKSVFCICPPGHSQWTSRPFKALISGCIPVTFFREHDNPWADELDYSTVSVNMDPDELHTLKERLDAVPVKKLQRNIEAIQEAYRWTGEYNRGAEAMLLKRLRQRGCQLQVAEQLRKRALQ